MRSAQVLNMLHQTAERIQCVPYIKYNQPTSITKAGNTMNIGIAGLGLIGGSFAKAYKKAGINVYGFDGNRTMEDFAQLDGTLVGRLDETTIPLCDLILIALYPQDSMDYLEKIAPLIAKTTLVMDCCGVKGKICQLGFQLAEKYGFDFVGGHPMAGT